MLLDRFGSLMELLAAFPGHHARDSAFYRFLDGLTQDAFHEVKPAFVAGQGVVVGEFGSIILPYEEMGAIDSIDLFGLDELILFAYYYKNRGRYRRAADIGANIGLHSILLSRIGCQVEAFEPDPQHSAKLARNLDLNAIADCLVHRVAVSDHRGQMEFVRVLGNTTSSHLAGAKPNPWGELERFEVDVEDIREIAGRVDFMKIDAEGHEAVILSALAFEAWRRVDAVVEIGSTENARAVFDHFTQSGIGLFSQKRGWGRVERFEDMPTTYREGGLFISAKPAMPW
jgi:FkbM family methyltransferase